MNPFGTFTREQAETHSKIIWRSMKLNDEVAQRLVNRVHRRLQRVIAQSTGGTGYV